MPIKFLIFIMLLSFSAFSEEQSPYLQKLQEKKYLQLPDGKEVILVRPPLDTHANHMRLFLREKGKILWDVTYHQDLDALWADAHFLPLYDTEFIADIDNDGFPEISLVIWGGGNQMANSRAIIYSVKPDKLTPVAKKSANYEFSYSLFKSKEDLSL